MYGIHPAADMMDAVVNAGFEFKNGASFVYRNRHMEFAFEDNRSSVGVVAEADFYQSWDCNDTALQDNINQEGSLLVLLKNAVFDDKINAITCYAANVKSLYDKGYALLGNAGEFLDPVFFSGVTIVMKSASLAAAVPDRQFKQVAVNWNAEYALPLQHGVDTFRVFVDAWYDGRIPDAIFHQKQQRKSRR